MIRVLFMFFLALCLLLSKGYAHDYQKVQQQHFVGILTQLSEKSKQFYATPYQTLLGKENLLSYEENNDDDDCTCAYKQYIPYLDLFCNATTSIFSESYNKAPLPCCQHLSYTSSYKYIIQRVIKI